MLLVAVRGPWCPHRWTMMVAMQMMLVELATLEHTGERTAAAGVGKLTVTQALKLHSHISPSCNVFAARLPWAHIRDCMPQDMAEVAWAVLLPWAHIQDCLIRGHMGGTHTFHSFTASQKCHQSIMPFSSTRSFIHCTSRSARLPLSYTAACHSAPRSVCMYGMPPTRI